jgi:hypothetical protein
MVRGLGRGVIPAVHLAGWATITYQPSLRTKATAAIVQEYARECRQLATTAATAVYDARWATDEAAQDRARAAVVAVVVAHEQTWQEALAVVKACATPHRPSTKEQILEQWTAFTKLEVGVATPQSYEFPTLKPHGNGRLTVGLEASQGWRFIGVRGEALDIAHRGIVDELLDALLDPEEPYDDYENVIDAAVTYQQAREGSGDDEQADAYLKMIEVIDAPDRLYLDPHAAHTTAQMLAGFAAMAWADRELFGSN